MTAKAKLTAAQKRQRTTLRTARGTFYTAGAATIAANMYASAHTFVGLATGFWTPVALFLALEMAERVPCKGRMALMRKAGVALIALVAAWVSYWHLVHIFTMGGADVVAAHAMPLTVDVLMAIARSAMVHRPSLPARRSPAKKAPAKPLRIVQAA